MKKIIIDQIELSKTKVLSLDLKYKNFSNRDTNPWIIRTISMLKIQTYKFGSKTF